MMAFGFAEIGQILEVVKKAGGQIPDGFEIAASDSPERWEAVRQNRLRLGHDLSWAFTYEMLVPATTSDARARERFKELESLSAKATTLLRALSEADAITTMSLNMRGANCSVLVSALEDFSAAVGAEIKFVEAAGLDSRAPLPKTDKTPQAWVLTSLTNAYEKHLKLPRRIRYNDNIPEGPFIAFIIAAYSIAGWESPTAAAVQKGLERAGLGNKLPDKSQN